MTHYPYTLIPEWHCPPCEVQWTARQHEPCFVCGRPAAKGPHLNSNGKPQPTSASMTWDPRVHTEATV